VEIDDKGIQTFFWGGKMKWTKLDGFNQPNGLTVMRWTIWDSEEEGSIIWYYLIGNYQDEKFQHKFQYNQDELVIHSILELMYNEAEFICLENYEEPE